MPVDAEGLNPRQRSEVTELLLKQYEAQLASQQALNQACQSTIERLTEVTIRIMRDYVLTRDKLVELRDKTRRYTREGPEGGEASAELVAVCRELENMAQVGLDIGKENIGNVKEAMVSTVHYYETNPNKVTGILAAFVRPGSR